MNDLFYRLVGLILDMPKAPEAPPTKVTLTYHEASDVWAVEVWEGDDDCGRGTYMWFFNEDEARAHYAALGGR